MKEIVMYYNKDKNIWCTWVDYLMLAMSSIRYMKESFITKYSI